MGIEIRSERPGEYGRIAQINYEAFLGWHPDNYYVSEPILVALLRQNTRFDPELSLVAEEEGEVVGHVLLNPYDFILCGAKRRGVVLAPIAVLPAYQKKGIGKMLIHEAHRRAREKGFAFSLLCGHASYYPQFGYIKNMFSLGGCEIQMELTRDFNDVIEERPVFERDIPWIIELWERQHQNDSLALFPGRGVTDWCNVSASTKASVLMSGDLPVGYVRYSQKSSFHLHALLMEEGWERKILMHLFKESESDILGVSLTPSTIIPRLAALEEAVAIDQTAAYDAFMICPLDDGSGPGSLYCRGVARGDIQPGVISFTNIFDIEDGRIE